MTRAVYPTGMDCRDPADDSATPVHIEFALAHVIAHSRIQTASAIRRLNGFENTLAALSVEWRVWRPIIPSKEIRMSRVTNASVVAWVTANQESLEETETRLVAYLDASLMDETVPEGWVRLLLYPETDSGSQDS